MQSTSYEAQEMIVDGQQQVLVEWNRTPADYPSNKCIHQLFEQRVSEAPAAIAVVCGSLQLTYQELNQKANQLANYLHKLGAGPSALVGICMYRSVEMIIGILGTLKAGAAYVPLDPAYPQKRLASMLEDVELHVLLTSHDLLPALSDNKVKRVPLDSEWVQMADEDVGNLPSSASVRDICYVIFTSGSTGKAKATAVFHGGWTNLMHWFVTGFNVQSMDRVLVISSFSFDITQRSIVMPLISGGQLHLLASNYYDPALILQTIADQGITRLNCAPSTFYPLVENSRDGFSKLRSLRTVFLGGEAISASRIREWAESRECSAEIANVYGVAECSDVSTFYVLKDYERYVGTSVPIGKPIFNTQIYLTDESLNPVPFGQPGEICIAGDGVGSGYLNDRSLTEQKFVKNPFDTGGAGRLYRTGDLGRFSSDWNLEFVGRVDHQVKLRGFRIDLGDIESNLRQHKEVKEAVVLSKSFSEQDQRLVAFVVPRHHGGSRDQTGSQLRSFLKQRLPEYMVPNDVVILEEIPLNPNGKTDRNALLSMDILALGTKAGSEEPRTVAECDLATIFANVLKLERVGIVDNFFDLGGHSYLMTEALGCIADKFHVNLSIFDFLANPKVTSLLKRIEEVRQEDVVADPEPRSADSACNRVTPLAENTIPVIAPTIGTNAQLRELQRFQAEHPIWDCRLIRACRAGLLTKEDFKHVFGQYYRYSKHFTRYLTALMTNCESDYYRSLLSENLWEEGGGAEPDKRHAELFREFLREALGVDVDAIQYQSFADEFFHQCLDFCRNSSALCGSAFLSLGTEGAIARLYGYFYEGLLKAGISEERLAFFRIHMECDDKHAITLADLMRSFSDEPGWFEQCKAAIDQALNIRRRFLDEVFDVLLQARLQRLLGRLRGEHTLVLKSASAKDFVNSKTTIGAALSGLYSNRMEHLNIDFSVQRVDFGAEVFDVRQVSIAPHHNTEHHRHAHESLLTVVKGKGRVLVADFTIDVGPGDTVFVPRWTMHQTQNATDETMELLAITDYGLTRQALIGDHLRTTRMIPERDVDSK